MKNSEMLLVGAALVAFYLYSQNKTKATSAPAAGSLNPITTPTNGTGNTGVNSGLNGTLAGLENVVGTELLNWWHGIANSNTNTYANSDVSAPADNSSMNSSSIY